MNDSRCRFRLVRDFTVTVAIVACACLFSRPAQSGVLTVRTNYNALVLYYNPGVWKDGQLRSYRQTYGSRDIDALSADYIKFVRRASGGQVNFNVAFRFELDEFPPDNDPAVTFTAQNYDSYRSSGYDMFNHGKADYVAICQDPRFGLVPKAESGQLDAVWVFAPDCTGFWETAMAGTGAFYVNGGAYPEISCSRKFVLYGFGSAAHQGVGFMLENTGHMMEVIMRDRIASGWPLRNPVAGWNTLDLTNPERGPVVRWLNDWSFFTCTDGMHWDPQLVAPGHSQAGLSHFPPTACENYGWADPRITFLPWEAENFLYLDGSWSAPDRVLVVTNVGPVLAKAMLNGTHNMVDSRGSYRVPVALTDFDVEAGVTVLQTNEAAHAGVAFRCSRYADGLGGQDGYYIGLQPGGARVQLYRLGPGTGHTLLSEAPCPLEPNTNYNVFLSARGSNITVRLDPRAAPVLTWSDAQVSFGGIGLGACSGSASFSHLNVTPVVQNYAETWRAYPNLEGAPRALKAAEWAGDGAPYTEMDFFYAWWYEHLPKSPGTHEVTEYSGTILGRALNSWWPYMFDINVFSTPFLPPGASVETPQPDTSPPQAPFGLAGIGISADEILLEWSEPADNIGVTRYEVYRDGVLAARTAKHSFLDSYLEPGSSHDYAVRSLDGSANASPLSQSVRIATGRPGELFRNGSFDEGLTMPVAWTHGAYNPDGLMAWEPPTVGRYGSRCISISSALPNDAWWTQPVSGLVPSGRYLVTAWIKGEDIVMETGGHSGASIGALDTWDSSAHLLTGTFDWTPVSCYLFADAAGRITVTCRLGHHGSLTTGTAWFDDVRLEYAPVLMSPALFWGIDSNGLSAFPRRLEECVALSCGDGHAIALTLSGQVLGWGDNSQGQASPPWGVGQVKALAAGGSHCLALLHDGQIITWGNNSSGQLNVPGGLEDAVALAGGSAFSMALRSNGMVVAWGNNDGGQLVVPSGMGRAVWITAGKEFAAALLTDSSVRSWGRYLTDTGSYASAFVPAGVSNVTSVACGHHHVLALLGDGTVRAWGRNAEGQSAVPSGLNRVIGIAAGADHSLALKDNGAVVSWGGNSSVPPGITNVFALGAGQGFSIALVQGRAPRSLCRIDRLSRNGNTLQVDCSVPTLGPGFLLKQSTLGTDDWSVASGEISPTEQLRFEPPMTGAQGFFKVKSFPW